MPISEVVAPSIDVVGMLTPIMNEILNKEYTSTN